jgi:hypothetical protein
MGGYSYTCDHSVYDMGNCKIEFDASLAAGTYYYNITAVDDNAHYTSTSSDYIINKAVATGSLASSAGWSIDEGTETTISYTGTGCGDSDLAYIIYENGTSVGTGKTWSPGAGTYTYVLNTTGGQNYSLNSNLDTEVLTVRDITPPSTSIVSIGGDTTPPYLTSDLTPSAVLSTGEDATCRWSDTDQGYDDMISSCSGGGTQSHTCDLGGGWPEDTENQVYFACVDATGGNHSISNNIEGTFNISTAFPAITVNSVYEDSVSPYSISEISPNVSLTTDIDATCRFSSMDAAYSSMNPAYSCSGGGTTSHLCMINDVIAEGNNNVYFSCNSTLGNENSADNNADIGVELDITPPTQGTHSPSGGSTILTRNPTITLETDEPADCRASLSDEDYSGMSDDFDCSGDGGTSHSCSISGLEGSSDTVYIICRDDTDAYPNGEISATSLTYDIQIAQYNITLYKGWNMVSLISDYTLDGTDRNISVEPGENLIGYSSNKSLNLSQVQFISTEGTVYTWEEASNAGKVQRFLSYRENRRYKYVGLEEDGMHDYALRPNKAYKLFANEAGNITLPGAGGSPPEEETFDWSNIEAYRQGTVATLDSGTADNWLFLPDDQFIYYYTSTGSYDEVYGSCGISPNCKETISPWEGYFIYSDEDEIVLLVNE